jgi:hypothetical protein
VTEQLGLPARSPADGALKLSSAVITAGGSGPHDLECDPLLPWELSISAQVLGEIEIMLATTHRPAGSTEDTGAANRAGGQHELHVNSVLLSLIPDVIHLVGRGLGAPRNGGARSYTLTLTFSEGTGARSSWTTTFQVPRSPIEDSTWRLSVPFGRSAEKKTSGEVK